jgi:hypothetical protein
MNSVVEFSHQELTLALFALEGGEPGRLAGEACSLDDDACPVVERIADLFEHTLAPEKRLSRHLDKHLRQSWVECGLLEVLGPASDESGRTSSDKAAELSEMNQRLREWKCEIQLEDAERLDLSGALSRLPRSAWITMPRTLWRLKRKLKLSKKGR